MARIKLPHLAVDRDRHGNIRYYFRKSGQPKKRLLGKPGTPEFMAAYNAALSAPAIAAGKITTLLQRESFGWVCKEYFSSAVFRALDPSTQNWRRRELEKLCLDCALENINDLRPVDIQNFMERKASKPGAANNALKALKALCKWCISKGHIKYDPTISIRKISYKTNGHHTWTESEVSRFMLKHPVGTKAHLALKLFLKTACRIEDVVRFGPHNVCGDRFNFTQAKNEHRSPIGVSLSIVHEITPIINASVTGRQTYLVTEQNRAFSVKGFGNKFREWCDQAGLPNCSAHGLRKLAATRLAEAGATTQEIMAITGHQTIQEVERYTRAANRLKLADSGLARLR